MTRWKYVRRAIGVVIFMAIPNASSASRESESDSAARTPNKTDTDRSKIVGKGVYTLEQLKGMPGFSLINPCPGPPALTKHPCCQNKLSWVCSTEGYNV